MKRFIQGESREQVTLLPECLDDYIGQDNPVRIVDAFVEELDLLSLGFGGADPAVTGRPAYHPGVLLKLYIYGYLNRIQSSRRLEREAQRNVELMWLTGRLAPDFKTIADFRKDNGPAIRRMCSQSEADISASLSGQRNVGCCQLLLCRLGCDGSRKIEALLGTPRDNYHSIQRTQAGQVTGAMSRR